MNKPVLGILGGIFNPVHYGHLSVASMARDHFNLDKLLFIPSGTAPHKENVTVSPQHRVKMLSYALSDFEKGEIWEGEIERNGYSYTVDSLKIIEQIFPDREYLYVIGSDNLKEIKSWRDYKTILKMVTLCVAHRPGYQDEIPDYLSGAKIVTIPSPNWGLSSSMLRDYLRKGLSCQYLVPNDVLRYIKKNNLYV
ncbi:nicotinate (nicotinamide) nucleotide adenylyltransferase [Chitinispirillales bacterium ANBcel5]|uniref:nicotinate (nicotinamide) nucleotide adenylyltransferase n=1 Tax=Cellulosispirillum alkaliphilum TaxID=3039283 RepID=UPI002A5779E4|nr:nicotinate (nicotinamide) nucleotide adenylyltransferase [Chitinispirillales bacterium ANBcel5]